MNLWRDPRRSRYTSGMFSSSSSTAVRCITAALALTLGGPGWAQTSGGDAASSSAPRAAAPVEAEAAAVQASGSPDAQAGEAPPAPSEASEGTAPSTDAQATEPTEATPPALSPQPGNVQAQVLEAKGTAPTSERTVAEAAVVDGEESDSLEERRLVAIVATGVAVASLATGVVFGLMAQDNFDCARDILACNASRDNKVVGTELFDLRSEIEQQALVADMGYLFAAASGVVATVGFIRSMPAVGESDAPPAAAAPPPVPASSTEVAP